MKHFTYKEYSKTSYNIKNTPSKWQYSKFEVLVKNILDPLREELGEHIIISSGYRCNELNNKIGGVKNSQHLANLWDIAVDIQCKSLIKCYELLKKYDLDQCILEHNKWIHIGYRVDGINKNQYFIM